MFRSKFLVALLILLTLVSTPALALARDLPSWQDGPTRTAILKYLEVITDPAHPDFIDIPERVAVFDNDGTFWCERPNYASTLFQRDLLIKQLRQGQADSTQQPFKAWIQYNRDDLRAYGWTRSYQEMNQLFAGMPVTSYRDAARVFLDRHPHEDFNVRHTELYYQPMLELARLLEEHSFQVWVVTGAEQDFVRSYIEAACGIPPERVIGTWTPAVSKVEGNQVKMVRGAQQVNNGYEAKPGNIETRIGRRPVFSVGNSNNDQAMCLYTITGPRRSLALWVHHDDSSREYSYDRGTDRMARLVKDFDGAYEVSMRRDWLRVWQKELKR